MRSSKLPGRQLSTHFSRQDTALSDWFCCFDAGAVHVRVVNEFPEDLYQAMREFFSSHPNWDQYRLLQAALAGFLFQRDPACLSR